MRISDWSSDVCSSYPLLVRRAAAGARVPGAPVHRDIAVLAEGVLAGQLGVDHLALDPVRGVVADVVAGQQAVALAAAGFLVGVVYVHGHHADLVVAEAQGRADQAVRSEARRVGKECVSTGRIRRSPYQ